MTQDIQTGVKSTDSNTPSSVSLTSGLCGPPDPVLKRRESAEALWNKTELKTGAKYDSGKVGLHLLPPEPLMEIAKVLDFGAKKYDAWNWSKGISYSRVYGALLRHLFAWWKGEDTDPESGLKHLAHAGCCVLFLLQYSINRNDFDDRPKGELT